MENTTEDLAKKITDHKLTCQDFKDGRACEELNAIETKARINGSDALKAALRLREEYAGEFEENPNSHWTRITSPGKFEGESLYVPYFFDLWGDSFSDYFGGDSSHETSALNPFAFFLVSDEEQAAFPELADVYGVMLEESEQGFVSCEEFATETQYAQAKENLENMESNEGADAEEEENPSDLFIYSADVWCGSCGREIRERLAKVYNRKGESYPEDSDRFPQGASSDNEETDSPSHCGAGPDCLEAQELGEPHCEDGHPCIRNGEACEYGDPATNEHKIGKLLSHKLTSDGWDYVYGEIIGDPQKKNPVVQFWAREFEVTEKDLATFAAGPNGSLHNYLASRPFLASYIETALWSSTDWADETGGEPLDRNYGPEDLAPETLAKMQQDCEDFLANEDADKGIWHTNAGNVAHNFWLNRNGHGAGFWDGDYKPEDDPTLGDRLDTLSNSFGETNLCVGDDGKLYLS